MGADDAAGVVESDQMIWYKVKRMMTGLFILAGGVWFIFLDIVFLGSGLLDSCA